MTEDRELTRAEQDLKDRKDACYAAIGQVLRAHHCTLFSRPVVLGMAEDGTLIIDSKIVIRALPIHGQNGSG